MGYIRRKFRFRSSPKNPVNELIKEKHSHQKKRKTQNEKEKNDSK